MDPRTVLVIDIVGTEKRLDKIDASGRLEDDVVHFRDPAFLGSSYFAAAPWSRCWLGIQKGDGDEVASRRS